MKIKIASQNIIFNIVGDIKSNDKKIQLILGGSFSNNNIQNKNSDFNNFQI